MSIEIRTPFVNGQQQVELSESGGLWRKQILRKEAIDYTDRSGNSRRIDFNDSYLRSLVDSFNSRAYDQVPLQLATEDNRHNNDPERYAGELVKVELTDDGIDGIIRPTDRGRKILEQNGKMGVSCRIIENLRKAGKSYPMALQHVLLTLDPQIPDLRPWQKVELSVPVTSVIDLSSDPQKETDMADTDTTDTVTLEVTPEQRDQFLAMLEDMQAAEELGNLIAAEDDGTDEVDDENGDEPDQDGETELSSVPDSDQYEVLLARSDTQHQQIVELTTQLQRAQLDRELERLGAAGLAPAIIDCARPLLTIPDGAIELSNYEGERIDPAELTRRLLRTVVDLANSGQAIVDLSGEVGYGVSDAESTAREEMVEAWASTYGY